MKSFDKEQTRPYFEHWEQVASLIESLYDEKNKKAVELMLEAIANYEQLLEYGRKELDEYTLMPLNGIERLAFIKKRIQSHYANVQLNMLYAEVKKKVARISAMESKKQRSQEQ